jgi:flavin reductase (DIM6/NTAB) family NADH-FMN oxidoreductase RutF
MRIPVDLPKACRLLNHGPTVLVTSNFQDKRNVMAASWSMALDFSPPKVAVVIEEHSYTRQLVDASGMFALNLPVRSQAELTFSVGHESGRDGDKFSKYDISTFKGQTDLPLIEGCVGWLECRVISEPHNQTKYDLFIGEVVAAWADDRAFLDGRWLMPPSELNTLHYIAGGNFFLNSEMIRVKE